MLNRLQLIGSVRHTNLTRGMQVVVSLDSTKVLELWEYHSRFVLSLSAKAYTKYVLLE